MKKINLYILEKLKINKDSNIFAGIDIKFGKNDEYFSIEEKEKCVELCKELPELPLQIIDGYASNNGKNIIPNVVALKYKNSADGKLNFIGIQKMHSYGFNIQIRSHRYKRDYRFPKTGEMLNIQNKPVLQNIEDVFKHIKEYWNKHKNWNK